MICLFINFVISIFINQETSKFSYAVGTVYTYDYLAEAATQISGTSDEESRVHITAQAEFEVASQCEFILRVDKLSLFT